MKVTVLGAGLVGSAIARDLAENDQLELVSVDIDPEALRKLSALGISTQCCDIKNTGELRKVLSTADMIVGAVPGSMGYEVVKNVIEMGKDMVDISFFPEDPFSLHVHAKEKGVKVVVDCGVAPGLGNIVLGHYGFNKNMDITDYKCYVGGLPVKREWPYQYKAVFSPVDVIEEYIRPARFVLNGKEVVREALSDTELINFDKVGTLEAWNSDGLRSLIKSFPEIPNMIEKTLRYPGSVEYLKVLRESGFFSYEEVDVKGTKIRPVDLTAKLLFPLWKLGEGEKEFTVMKILIEGRENDREFSVQWDLLDYYNVEKNVTSMARTTGYTCNAVVNLLAANKVDKTGIIPPEYLGEDTENFTFILNYLKNRGVIIQKEVVKN